MDKDTRVRVQGLQQCQGVFGFRAFRTSQARFDRKSFGVLGFTVPGCGAYGWSFKAWGLGSVGLAMGASRFREKGLGLFESLTSFPPLCPALLPYES